MRSRSFASTGVIVLAAALIFLLVSTVLLFSGREEHEMLPRSVKEVWNLGHVIYFFVLVALARRFGFLGRWPPGLQWLFYCGLIFAVGVLIEFIQMTPRIPVDWIDVSRDMVGGLAALALTERPLTKAHLFWRNSMLSVLSIVFLMLLYPLIKSGLDETRAMMQFPVLSDFGSSLELGRWSSRYPMRTVTLDEEQSVRVLRVDLDPAQYAGLALEYMPRDWRGYSWLELNIYQPKAEPLSITVRLHDFEHERGRSAYAYSDRFNKSYVLREGWNHIRISLDEVRMAPFLRDMNLGEMANLGVFVVRLDQPWTIYLSTLKLSN